MQEIKAGHCKKLAKSLQKNKKPFIYKAFRAFSSQQVSNSGFVFLILVLLIFYPVFLIRLHFFSKKDRVKAIISTPEPIDISVFYRTLPTFLK